MVSVCGRDSCNIVGSSAPRWAAHTPECNQSLRQEQSQPRAGLPVRVSAAVTGKAPGSGLPADPGKAGGGNQRSPWGTDTVAVVWTQVLGVPFGSPSSSLASGPSPSLTHQPVDTRTEMPLATRPHPPAHTPNAQPPLDRALPTRGPRTMGTWPHASVHRCAPGALQPEAQPP